MSNNLPAMVNDSDIVDLPQARNHANLIQVIWQRKSLVILGIVIGMVLGSLYFAQRAPTYQSQAQVLVVKKNPESMGKDSISIEDYMSTQSMIVRSMKIADLAANMKEIKDKIESKTLKSFPDATKPEDVAYGIMGALSVTRDNKEANSQQAGNNVLILNFKGSDADECEMFLRNIIKGYQDYLDDIYQSQSTQFMNQINTAKKQLDEKIKKAQEDLFKHVEGGGEVSSKLQGGLSASQKKFEMLSNEIAKAKIELENKQSTYEHFKKLYDEQGAQSTITAIITSGQRGILNSDNEFVKKITELLIMKEQRLSQVGPNHPDVKAINTQIEATRRNYFKKKPDQPDVDPNEAENDPALLFVKSMKDEVERLTKLQTDLNIAYTKAEQEVSKANKAQAIEDGLKDQLSLAKALFQQVVLQIERVDLTKGGGYKADTITRAGIGRRVAPMPFQVFTASGLLGTLLGIGLAYLAEISDKSFRNPVEIRRRLGLPVIGHVPYLAADDKAQELVESGSATVDPMLITHYQSNSIGAEAYRGVRTALYFSTRGEAHKVIQVTSPNVSDGKSTLAANLAVSIAQSGKRTLLIDADFRKPRVHRIFNVPATVGMASVMAGQCDMASAIQPTAVPNLSVLPCGPRPANPAELLTSPKFKELLDELRTQFDFVIVDTPPILVVTDPAVVAPRVDGVILCIRVTKNGRPFAERAVEVLHSLGANVIGVVVNGFGNQVGGKSGYEHYHYGYGEGGTYTYGYTYADKEAASYYGGQPDELPPASDDK